MKISKQIMLSALCLLLQSTFDTTQSAEIASYLSNPLEQAVAGLGATKQKNGTYKYRGHFFSSDELITEWQMQQNPNGAAPVIDRQYPTERLVQGKPTIPSELKKEIANLEQDIASTHANMLKLVNKIAGTNLTKKIQLLRNIATHEKQSELSLKEHHAKVLNGEIPQHMPLVEPPFPGCPYCG
jgi:hypothetical protein